QALPRVLGSVADLGAEIIVGDTGSTDATVAVAQKLGAKVSVLAWHDDFGDAQNQTLAQATGEWVFWLNPDEEFVSPGRQALETLLARPDARADGVRVQEIARADQPDRTTETLHPRLFRRHPDISFVGRLHPHFAVPLAELARRQNQHVYPTDLVVRHHAYL